MLRRSFLVSIVLCLFAVAPSSASDNWQKEAGRLAALLHWRAGDVVAEIGAGNGELTLEAAHRVGTQGKVYTTELLDEQVTHLKGLAAKEKNITVIKAGEADTNLPPGCCDSIFMRLVYHHLTKPEEIAASLFRSVKPGGRLAVVDEDPAEGTSIPAGVPKNRVGHGIPQEILKSELLAAGFKLEVVQNDWPGRNSSRLLYCVVFRKPGT